MDCAKRDSFVAILVLVCGIVGLFLTTPVNGDFGWNESARNALSGAFVRDLLVDMPLGDPVGWAEAYYAKYPALVILFYPPLLHGMLGLFAIPFGVSHLAAVLVVFAFYTALVFGVYAIARRLFEPLAAAGVSLTYTMSPEVATWGRQIMHEIPMMALVVSSVWFGLRYTDDQRPRDLYAMAFFGICSLYTKQTAIFVILAFGLYLLAIHGRTVIRKTHFWATVLCSIVALVPLLVIQLKFASFNAVNLGAHPSGVSPATVEGLVWYLVRMPGTLGWPVIVAAVLFASWKVRVITRKNASRDALFLTLWFVLTYVAFTLISLKETRHGIAIYLPVAFAAVGLFGSLPIGRWRQWTALGFGVFVFATTLLFHPPHRDLGYAEAADVIVAQAPDNAVVLFAGSKDGDFIYNVRANDERDDITVLRADKLFLNINILPALGLNAKDVSTEDIREQLIRYGVSYVVSDEKSFIEAQVIRNLMSVLHSDTFERVRRIDVVGVPTPWAGVEELVIYRNLADLPEKLEKPTFQPSAMERKIKN